MIRFVDRSLGFKLALAFGVVIALGLTGYFQTVRALRLSEARNRNTEQSVDTAIGYAKDALLLSNSASAAMQGYVYSGNDQYREDVYEADGDAVTALTEWQEALPRLANSGRRRADVSELAQEQRSACEPVEDRVIRLVNAGRRAQAQQVFVSRCIGLRGHLNISITRKIADLEADRQATERTELETSAQAVRAGWGVQGIIALLCALIGLTTTRRIAGGLAQLERTQEKLRQSERQMVEAQRIARVGSWHNDFRTRTSVWSDEMFRALGYEPGQVTPGDQSYLERIHPDDYAHVRDTFLAARERAEPFEYHHRIIRPDGEVRWLHMLGEFGCGAAGRPTRMHGTAQDVTERIQSEQALQDSERRFRALVQNSSDIITILDGDGLVLYKSPSEERIMGYAPDEMVGTSAFDLIHPDDRRDLLDTFRRVVSEPGEHPAVQFRTRHAQGDWLHLEAVPTNLLHDPSVNGIVVNSRDITERKLSEMELSYQAFHDALTGLPNRSLLMDRLERALEGPQTREAFTAVLYLDLDNFKVVNDSLGHTAGDALLMAVAERLTACVAPSGTVARIGGDEFIVLLDHVRGEEEAVALAGRIADRLTHPVRVRDRDVFVTTSLGIAYGGPGQTPEGLLSSADVAMYEAKKGGKAAYSVFHDSMTARAMERLELEAELRRALDGDELRLHYQPIVSLGAGELREVEALVRWQHPERGLIPPSKFIPLAEETGMIVPLGRWVLREACRQARAWERAGLPGLTMSVNLSARQLQQPDLVDEVRQTLADTGLDPARLKLEITESVMMEDAEATTTRLAALKSLGVRLAVDDFGTGYSSMAYLSRFPIDTLKIDRAFVQRLDDPEGYAIVHAIITLARSLRLSVTSEGIETPAQREALAALGSDYGQGYLFSRPLPASELPLLLLQPQHEREMAQAA